MRMTKRNPARRARAQAKSAVRRLPRWSSPVGDGAKRPVPILGERAASARLPRCVLSTAASIASGGVA